MTQLTQHQLFSDETRQKVREVVTTLNRDQMLWLNGYTSAVVELGLPVISSASATEATGTSATSSAIIAGIPVTEAAEVTEATSSAKLKILYGTHSGNSQKVAAVAHEEAQKAGIDSSVESLTEYNVRQLKDESQVLLIVSTHGEGEPPVAAADLYELLNSKKAPKLNGSRFAVIALGDSAYRKFCQTGIDFHHFFKKQGAEAVLDVVKLDVDFQEQLPIVLPDLIARFGGLQSSDNQRDTSISNAAPVAVTNHDVPVAVPVLEKVQLNGRGSDKETWHLEISTDGTGLQYQPGDALEVYARNSPALVDAIIAQLGLSSDELVTVDGHKVSLHEALTHYYEITIVTPQVLKKYATLLGDNQINILFDDADLLDQYLKGTDFLDVLREYPLQLSANQLLDILRKLPPRLYSISSSPLAVGDEVHITVGAVRFEKAERQREGVCSTFLADRLGDDENLKVKIRQNHQFRLPAKEDAPVIMVGAGTGIAPFRAFLQHREASKASGKNWLVFGDQHFITDFLYQAEWLKYRKEGLLTRIDVAFSRDQEEKIYVQDRLKQNSAELFRWIIDGAHFYVCGDMKKMAKDVKNTFIEILSEHGKTSREDAEKWLNQLKKEGRYQEDVY